MSAGQSGHDPRIFGLSLAKNTLPVLLVINGLLILIFLATLTLIIIIAKTSKTPKLIVPSAASSDSGAPDICHPAANCDKPHFSHNPDTITYSGLAALIDKMLSDGRLAINSVSHSEPAPRRSFNQLPEKAQSNDTHSGQTPSNHDSLAAKLKTLSHDYNTLKSDQSALQSKCAQLENQLRLHYDENKQLVADNNELYDEIQKNKTEFDLLLKKCRVPEKNLSSQASQTVSHDYNTLKSDHSALQSKCTQLEIQLRLQYHENKRIVADNNELYDEIQKNKTELNLLLKKCGVLEKNLSSQASQKAPAASGSAAQPDNQASLPSDLNNVVAELKAQNSLLQDKTARLEADNKKMELKIPRLIKWTDELKDQISKLNGPHCPEGNDFINKYHKAAEELQTLSSDYDYLAWSHDNLTASHAQLSRDNLRLIFVYDYFAVNSRSKSAAVWMEHFIKAGYSFNYAAFHNNRFVISIRKTFFAIISKADLHFFAPLPAIAKYFFNCPALAHSYDIQPPATPSNYIVKKAATLSPAPNSSGEYTLDEKGEIIPARRGSLKSGKS
jgi:hypothetical protein